jgi:hypothetical protein
LPELSNLGAVLQVPYVKKRLVSCNALLLMEVVAVFDYVQVSQ